MSTTDELLDANAGYAATFAAGDLAAPPSRRVAVVTCMDARIDAFAAFGLDLGDAHVLRNAGGVVTDDVLRSLTISQRKLGTREVLLVHHTRCGMASFADEDFVAELEAETGRRPDWVPGAFADTEADLRDGLARVRACPFLPHTDAVRAAVYDVETGRVHEVS